VSPLAAALRLSISAAVRARVEPAGWIWHRDAASGHELWTEPSSGRQVRIDEIPGQVGGRVVEGFNGHERVLIRCTQDTAPELVLRTLADWAVVPSEGVTRR